MHKCQNFIGLHHFTGADWIAPLHGSRLGREVCWYHEDVLLKAYIALEDDHLANDCFIELDECLIQNLLANRELPTRALKTWKNLSVPRQVYWGAGPTTFAKLRWELFRSRNLEGEMLQSCMQVDVIAMGDKSYFTSCQIFLSLKRIGTLRSETRRLLERGGWNGLGQERLRLRGKSKVKIPDAK